LVWSRKPLGEACGSSREPKKKPQKIAGPLAGKRFVKQGIQLFRTIVTEEKKRAMAKGGDNRLSPPLGGGVKHNPELVGTATRKGDGILWFMRKFCWEKQRPSKEKKKLV